VREHSFAIVWFIVTPGCVCFLFSLNDFGFLCFRWSGARVEGQAASETTVYGYGEGELVKLFECAKDLLLMMHSIDGSSSSSSSSSSSLLSFNRLFSAFAASAASPHHESPQNASAAAATAAAAAAADANYDVFSDTLSLAHATHHALLAALQPPAAAAIASRSMLLAAIKTFSSLRSRLLRGAASSPSQAPR
jgi:hypothetical protein